MNNDNLKTIFKKYIDNFETINNEKNDETYKWEIVLEFQKFDVDAPDFADMLNHMWKITDNLIDSSQQLPFYALVDYARKEPETVREMFKKLYAKEHVDTDSKQKLINEFIATSEELRNKYYPDSRLYVNNQRSVMMYLFLRYPDSNFAYKAMQAKSFADCIGFYDDWGPMTDFKLDVFNRMCEQVVAEIKADKALMETHKSRFENTKRKLYPDENLHILVFDIIFSSQTYNFYDGMTYEPINAQARKLYFEKVAKAKELSEILENAKEEMTQIVAAKDYLAKTLVPGSIVKHKTFGEGMIEEYNDTTLVVKFPKTNDIKKFGISVVFGNGLMALSSDEQTEKIKEFMPLLNNEFKISTTISKTEKALQDYLEFLD